MTNYLLAFANVIHSTSSPVSYYFCLLSISNLSLTMKDYKCAPLVFVFSGTCAQCFTN